jgi:hypothetical protein
MNRKILYLGAVAAVAVAADWNVMQSQSDEALSDMTLVNVEALASESTGNFPACQKNKGAGAYATIPFCVNGVCQNNTWERKGILDVNYCNQ